MTAIIVDERGARSAAGLEAVAEAVGSGGLFWLDIVGESDEVRVPLLKALGLDDAEIVTAIRFRQSGRMRFGEDRLRVVTWIADARGALVELHLVGCGKTIVTLWSGDPELLDAIRVQFAHRLGGTEGDMPFAVGLLLQLLIGMLDASLETVDAQTDRLRLSLDQ